MKFKRVDEWERIPGMTLHERINALAGELIGQLISGGAQLGAEELAVICAICERHIEEILDKAVPSKRTKKRVR